MKKLLVAFAVLTSGFLVTTTSPAQNAARDAAQQFFRRHDTNSDNQLNKQEFPRNLRNLFDRVDKDGDGLITLEEDIAFRAARRARPARNRPQVPEGTRILRDLVYRESGDRKLRLDLYLPPNAGQPTPLVIWIHGGAWRAGSKGTAGPSKPLLKHGFAIADIEYRLSQEAIFPAQIQDCKSAVRWLRSHAKEHNLDPERFGSWGSSAGGHLSALLGTSGDAKTLDSSDDKADISCRVQAVVDWFGPTDFLQMDRQAIEGSFLVHDRADSPESQLVGGPIQEEPYRGVANEANPITYVSKDDPPFLIVHGDRDTLVPHKQSVLLQDALTEAGASAQLHIVEGGDHGFRTGKESQSELVEQAIRFFKQHLMEPAAAP